MDLRARGQLPPGFPQTTAPLTAQGLGGKPARCWLWNRSAARLEHPQISGKAEWFIKTRLEEWEEPTAGNPAIWGSTTARGAPWPLVTSALISHVIGCGSLHDPMRKCTYGVLPRLGLVRWQTWRPHWWWFAGPGKAS